MDNETAVILYRDALMPWSTGTCGKGVYRDALMPWSTGTCGKGVYRDALMPWSTGTCGKGVCRDALMPRSTGMCESDVCRDALHEMCSRHFISAYLPVGDAANDYRDVGGRAKQELDDYRDVGGRATPGAVAEPSTGARIAPGNPFAFPPSLAVMCESGVCRDALQDLCSRQILSAYLPVGDAANDYRDVIGRAKQEAKAERPCAGRAHPEQSPRRHSERSEESKSEEA